MIVAISGSSEPRAPGWYRVKLPGCTWECAILVEGRWCLTMSKRRYADEDFEAIGPRIPMPDETTGEDGS